MKKNIYIRDIKPGEKIYDFFFVTEKNLAYSQKGAPYLNLRLKDKTGELDGKVWDNVPELDRAFRKGDFVYLQTRAVQYKNAIQLAVMSARRAARSASAKGTALQSPARVKPLIPTVMPSANSAAAASGDMMRSRRRGRRIRSMGMAFLHCCMWGRALRRAHRRDYTRGRRCAL